ncbi:MAG: hypothetical protein M1832_004734 [Thelocarpon impressellum]|nr:MAG: hypothetical protein M1832_004734 [Thelocarpon impressellum]
MPSIVGRATGEAKSDLISERGLLIVTWLTFGLATVLTGFRLYVRRVKLRRFFWDDACHVFAWVILLVSAALYTSIAPVLYRVMAVTSGQQLLTVDFITRDIPRYVDFQFASTILFWVVLWAVKFSFLIFYRRFFRDLRSHMIAWWAVTAFTSLAFIACLVPLLTACGSTAAYFRINACLTDSAIRRTKFSIKISTSVDVLSDLMIMALPLRILWSLNITKRQKAGLATAFSLATIVIVFAIIRAVQTHATLTPQAISSLQRADPIALTLFSVLESSVAVIVSCLPSFRVLFLGQPPRDDHHADHAANPPTMAGASSSTRKPRRDRGDDDACRGCGPERPRMRLPKISFYGSRTLTSARGEGSQRTWTSDRTLVASPGSELKMLSPQPVRPPGLERPRMAYTSPYRGKDKPLPPPPRPSPSPSPSPSSSPLVRETFLAMARPL